MNDIPEMPKELEYLFLWWKREVASAEPLTWTALHSWAQVTGKNLMGWEADAIMQLDMLYRYVRLGVKT